MRNTPNVILELQIRKALSDFLNTNEVSQHTPLEYFADDILLLTLTNCCGYFQSEKHLRSSERSCLENLSQDLADKIDLSLIELRLQKNLAKIKPIWGEVFGTDRGLLYNTFKSLNEWGCFTSQARLYYTEQKQKMQYRETTQLLNLVSAQTQQLSQASRLVLQHETTTNALTQRATEQFATIQKLRIEKSHLQTALELQAQKPTRLSQTQETDLGF